MDDIEARLREFRPRRPRPIPIANRRTHRRTILVALAVAAGLVAVFLLSADFRFRDAASAGHRLNRAELTALALENPSQFEDAFARISAESLPDVTAPGALQVFAR